jgi:hypothetical protein
MCPHQHLNAIGQRAARLAHVAGVAAVLAIATQSCGPGESTRGELVPVPSTPPTLQVDVGTGTADFIELADGAPVDLVRGSQGGFHIWTAIRVHDERVTDVQVNLSTRLEDGTEAGPPSSAATTLSAPRDGARSAAGLRNFIASSGYVSEERVVLRVEVIASDKQHGAAEKVVTVNVK